MRKRNPCAVAAVVLGILLIPLWCATTKWSDPSKTPHSTGGWPLGPHNLPFSFEQVLSHFVDAFGKPAYKVHDRTFVYVEDNNLDDSVTIVISATERKIAVTLYASGDWGLNYIREFFEAPFFLRSESEQLYVLLDATPRTRTAALSRFDVKINIFKTRELIVIAIEFSPPGTTLPEVEASHTS